MNKSEKFVFDVCKSTFLSLWSYPNPIGKDSKKELCDILVICDPHVVIVSVKDIALGNSGNPETDWKRWHRKAIEDSAHQIYGAERLIKKTDAVIPRDGGTGLKFPSLDSLVVHRIAVAFGGKGEVPIRYGDFGKGFVHVLDERTFSIILGELNTIDDFVQYLTDKESFLSKGEPSVVFEGQEEDLLAPYLHHGRIFPTEGDIILIAPGTWDEFIKKSAYQAKVQADEISFVWDRLIEIFCEDIAQNNLVTKGGLHESEKAVRYMAKENRFARRILGKAYIEFMELASARKIESRMIPSFTGKVGYVFLAKPHGFDRQERVEELNDRCKIVRGTLKDCKVIVGIATEVREPGKGFSLDLILLEKDTWSEEDEREVQLIKKHMGFFANPISKMVKEDEYPDTSKV